MIDLFRLLDLNFIELLSKSRLENKFILYIIYYFARFFVIFSSKIVNVSDVIRALNIMFIFYCKSKVIY